MTLFKRFFALMLTLAFVALIPLGASRAQADTRAYISQNGLYTFNYPAEWVVRERNTNSIEMGTSIEALDLAKDTNPVLPAGSVIASISINGQGMNIPSDLNPSSGPELLISNIVKDVPEGFILQQAESVKYGQKNASRVAFTTRTLRGQIIAFFLEGKPMIVVAGIPITDPETNLAPLEDVISSLRPLTSTDRINTPNPDATYTPQPRATTFQPTRIPLPTSTPIGTQTPRSQTERYTALGSVFSVEIPSGWVARSPSDSYEDLYVYLATSDDLIDNWLSYSEWDYFYTGQYALYLVNYGPTSMLPDNMPMTRNLDVLLGFALGSQTKYTWETPIRDRVAGYDVALALGSAGYMGDVVQMAFYIGDTPYFLFGISGPGDRITLIFRMASVIKSIRPAS